MKKLLFLLTALFVSVCASAQINIVEGSFRDINAGDRQAEGSDIGGVNMTSTSMEWPTDADGNEDVALLVVDFENVPLDEIDNIVPSLTNQIVVAVEKRQLDDGKMGKFIFVPAKKGMDVTFSHPTFGSTRLVGKDFETHHIYTVRLRNNKLVNVHVDSDPQGAPVYFDQKYVGVTPFTIHNVTLGKHELQLNSPNDEIAESSAPEIINVTETATTFTRSLRRTRPMQFVSNPGNARLRLIRNGQEIGSGTGTMAFNNLPYGEYNIAGVIGATEVEIPVVVNAATVSPMYVEVVPSKAISFIAIQNNMPTSDASVSLDGHDIGKTPLTYPVPFGKHTVEMSYYGYSKKGKINVRANTDTKYELVLPNRRQGRHNPFNIDYKRREWGLTFMYVSRQFNLKANGRSTRYNMYGEEDKSDQGVQVGIAYQPYFGYGQGLSTGIFWQGFFGSFDTGNSGEKSDWQEHSVYIPLQYQFRLPITGDMSVFLNGGGAVNIGVSNIQKIDGETVDVGYGYNEDLKLQAPCRVNWTIPIGGGFQYKALQIEAKYIIGITNDKDMLEAMGASEGSTLKRGGWSVGLSLMF